ncbi:DUF7344 domain-containing protein [Halorussus amylolyticus]|uniref:DUF7344 domain-containing protein n=1 Tax=Halorussus amylolyticus TaxID=1126242 RepID=UPI00138F56FA|nr:hypothetical protein [Halorussus amylolyticus]
MSQLSNSSTGEQSTNAAPGESHGSHPRSLDSVFDVLATERRRNVLYALYESAGRVALSDLADEVASVEGADFERVATSLHHVHLPRLAEVGVVEYDHEGRFARLALDSELFRRYLALAAEDERGSLRRAAESASLSEF